MLCGHLHLEAAWTVQYLCSEVHVQGVFDGLVREGRGAEPAEFGACFLHRASEVDVLPTEGKHVFKAADAVQDCGNSSDVCAVDVVAPARFAGVAHFHGAAGGRSQGREGVQRQVEVGAAFRAEKRTVFSPFPLDVMVGISRMDRHGQAAEG